MSTPQTPNRRGCCSCGGCLATLMVLAAAVVVVIVLFYRAATTPYINLAAVATGSAASASAQQKLSLVSTAAQEAKSTGKPAPVSVTLTDSEMTSSVTDAVGLAEMSGSLPGIDGVVVHAAGGGTVQVQARVHFLVVTLPLYLAIQLATHDQKSFDVTVTDARLGSIPLPAGLVGGIVDQVRKQIVDRLNVPQGPKYDHAKVSVVVGQITVSATFEP